MRQFVPMTDDMLERVDELPGPLVPYQCGLPCWHGLQADPERALRTQAAVMPAAGDIGAPLSA
ncbi:MAG TPA: hypothetical protein VLB69_04970 [Rudaea sp.]|nr:hypothetical protein [Rudaea sp.]